MRFVPIIVLLLPASMSGALRLPAVLSDHAVLQAGRPVAIWGWANPRERVTVSFVGERHPSFMAQSDTTGRWFGHLPALAAGSAGSLEAVTEQGEKIVVPDILVGEVWLGGGQSNMDYSLAGDGRVDRANSEEVREVTRNLTVARQEADSLPIPLRYFKVLFRGENQPADDVRGNWVIANSRNIAHFSAVAWNFGVALQRKLRGPVGLVVSSVGNTPIEAWMSSGTLESTSVGAAIEARNREALASAEIHPSGPTRFYNGMIRGLEPYTIRGILWFQGDGNGAHPGEYGELFTALIRAWRREWQEGDLPFYFVELNNMREAKQSRPVQPNPVSLIREAQHQGLLLPGVEMISAIDLGTQNPHFRNKKAVGERLAAVALSQCYGVDLAALGPCFRVSERQGNTVRLQFDHATGLRLNHGSGALQGFAVRGASGDWQWAQGKIEGQDIVLWSDHLSEISAVRYAWAMNPVVSVENVSGLPLSPFRTDRQSPQ